MLMKISCKTLHSLLPQIVNHAVSAYPEECCGLILKCENRSWRSVRIKNIQNEWHRLSPEDYPRTAKAAYQMDPHELLALQKSLRHHREAIAVIYHSHPEAGFQLSDEDIRQALWDGEPTFPGVDYLVVSVRQGHPAGWGLYGWDLSQQAFQMRFSSEAL